MARLMQVAEAFFLVDAAEEHKQLQQQAVARLTPDSPPEAVLMA